MQSLARLLAVLLVAILALAGPGQTQEAAVEAVAQEEAAQAQAQAPAAPAQQATVTLSPRDAARALIGVLDNEEARLRLVGELDRIARGVETIAPGDAATPTALPKQPSTPIVTDSTFAKELGLYTEALAQDFTEVLKRVWIRLSHVVSVLTGTAKVDWPTAQDLILTLGLLAGVAFGVLWLARAIAQWPIERLAKAAVDQTPAMRLLLNVGVAALQLLCLAVATVAIMLTVAILRHETTIGIVERHFANAFTLVETVKIAIRLIFAPRRPTLRMLPISDNAARHWSYWLSRLADVLGYGVVLGVPIVTEAVSFAVALGFRMLVAITALFGFIALVVYNRARVRAGMVHTATLTRSVTLATTLSLVAPIWHVVAICYALLAFTIWITRPLDAIGFMVTATLETALTLVIGGGIMAYISRTITGGVRLPPDVKATLPLLEGRLNLLVPTILRVLRFVMAVSMILGVLQAWQFIDIFDWARTEQGAETLGRITASAVIVLIAMAIWIAATSWIEYRLNPGTGFVNTPRARTLLTLFRNAFTIAITVIGVMLALSELGVDIAPLIAGAGVLGLAIGFGSQKLVQDIINGAFIQFENAMNVGDVVTVAGISGVVEKLTIRSVGLRDVNGVYHIIPFSSVDSVSNSMRGFAFHVADIRVGRDTDVDEVKLLLGRAFDLLMKTPHQADILEPLEMNGIVEFAEGIMVIRARIKTLPGKQWAVGRAYSEIVKTVFNESNIPFPAGPAREWVQAFPTEVPERPAGVHPAKDAPAQKETEPAKRGVAAVQT